MDEIEKFCNIVKNHSIENSKAINLLYEHKLYGNCISVLRQELDSMVRVLFLLTCNTDLRINLITQTLNNEKWNIDRHNIKDFQLIQNSLKMHGWAKNVYQFGCAFIHLSIFHYYQEQDPFLKLSQSEIEVIKNFMVQYQEFPANINITFSSMSPYLLKIFEKINQNLYCHLEDLEKIQPILS